MSLSRTCLVLALFLPLDACSSSTPFCYGEDGIIQRVANFSITVGDISITRCVVSVRISVGITRHNLLKERGLIIKIEVIRMCLVLWKLGCRNYSHFNLLPNIKAKIIS
mmetsp:Transcript_7694/g.21591  ORF Transcript_7694/g.21591 Transcript_7694/m.21591 type:complete len:109 (+) Transcript_7694:339-665(+)